MSDPNAPLPTSEYWTREQIREYDRRAMAAGVPGPVLMENAARGCVDVLLGLGIDGPVHIVAGKGNNGGDGFVIARLLAGLGIACQITLLAPASELAGDAAIAFAPLKATNIPINAWSDEASLRQQLRVCSWVVDALLGTGTQGEIRSPYDAAIAAMNSCERRVLAVDLPSGMDANTGEATVTGGPMVRAHHTATFVAKKIGFANPTARNYTGQVHVINIGADAVVGIAPKPPSAN